MSQLAGHRGSHHRAVPGRSCVENRGTEDWSNPDSLLADPRLTAPLRLVPLSSVVQSPGMGCLQLTMISRRVLSHSDIY